MPVIDLTYDPTDGVWKLPERRVDDDMTGQVIFIRLS